MENSDVEMKDAKIELLDLPDEMLEEIVKRCGLSTVYNLSRTNKDIKKFTNIQEKIQSYGNKILIDTTFFKIIDIENRDYIIKLKDENMLKIWTDKNMIHLRKFNDKENIDFDLTLNDNFSNIANDLNILYCGDFILIVTRNSFIFINLIGKITDKISVKTVNFGDFRHTQTITFEKKVDGIYHFFSINEKYLIFFSYNVNNEEFKIEKFFFHPKDEKNFLLKRYHWFYDLQDRSLFTYIYRDVVFVFDNANILSNYIEELAGYEKYKYFLDDITSDRFRYFNRYISDFDSIVKDNLSLLKEICKISYRRRLYNSFINP